MSQALTTRHGRQLDERAARVKQLESTKAKLEKERGRARAKSRKYGAMKYGLWSERRTPGKGGGQGFEERSEGKERRPRGHQPGAPRRTHEHLVVIEDRVEPDAPDCRCPSCGLD